MWIITKNALRERLRRKELYIVVAVGILILLLCSSGTATITMNGEPVTSIFTSVLSIVLPVAMVGILGILFALAVYVLSLGISVTVWRERDEAVLIVADDGTEIDEKVRQSMFLAFVRGDASRSTSGGTGLGLAIAKGIARKHGGDVGYRYEQGKNKFFLRLPCAGKE